MNIWKVWIDKFRTRRLGFTFAILATLSAGILIGSVVAHGVDGKEAKVDSSDAQPLQVPNPVNLSTTFTKIAKDVGPAVVNINTVSYPKNSTGRHFQGNPQGQGDNGQGDEQEGPGQGQQGQGQGDNGMQDFFNHVVEKADKIWVKLSTDPDGDQGHAATVVGTDKSTDIAVLKINVGTQLPTVKLGNSEGTQIGDWVVAIGSPFGLNQT